MPSILIKNKLSLNTLQKTMDLGRISPERPVENSYKNFGRQITYVTSE
jgi:hypothetical protein